MPQEAKGKSTTAAQQQRALEKESKRARGALSCAECRRLKLKCDKTVPCSSCQRRGCGSICPQGELVTGGGTRFVLASTEQLHNKVKQMSDRIQALEDALRLSHGCQSQEPHPLLTRELLAIKSGLDLHSAVRQDAGASQNEEEGQPLDDAFGTLAINAGTGSSTFYGRSAGSESLLMNEKGAVAELSSPVLSRSKSPETAAASPSVALQLPSSFPFPSPLNIPLSELIDRHIPPWEEALRYTQLYS